MKPAYLKTRMQDTVLELRPTMATELPVISTFMPVPLGEFLLMARSLI